MSDDYTKVGEKRFRSPINLEGSWGERNLSEDAESVMELYFRKDNTGFIEWEIEELEQNEDIGLTFEIGAKGERKLCDYDGIFSLPDQAIDLMREHGVIVPNEYDDRVLFRVMIGGASTDLVYFDFLQALTERMGTDRIRVAAERWAYECAVGSTFSHPIFRTVIATRVA